MQEANARHDDMHVKQFTLQLSWQHQFQFAGYYAAKAKGYYQDAGLDITLLPFNIGDEKPVDSVVSGEVDFAIGDNSLLIDRANFKPVKLLANIIQHNPNILLTLEKSGIQSTHDMPGKKIAFSMRDDATKAMLKSEGLSIDLLQITPQRDPVSALIKGKVDIISAYSSDVLAIFKQRGIGINTISSSHIKHIFYGDNIFTSERLTLNQPEAVQAFIHASLKGWKYALDNPHEIIEIIQRKYSQKKSREALALKPIYYKV